MALKSDPAQAGEPSPDKPDERFGPHQRMRDRRDFQRALARRRAVSDPNLVVHAAENGRDCARLGLSVSRKVARLSVERHRLKRLVREVFRRNPGWFAAGVDFFVVVRARGLTHAQIEQSLAALARDAARRLAPRSEPQP
jgi:ribonuclease P protein component